MAPSWVISIGFVLGFVLGAVILLWTLFRPPSDDSGSGKISIGKWQFQFTGRAVFQLAVGTMFVLFPALLATAAKPTSIVPAARNVQEVDKIPDPSYAAFAFARDLSVLDLREGQKESPWALLPFLKRKSHPVTLTNVMLIQKVSASDVIAFKYATSGRLDIRCLTHECTLKRAFEPDEHAAGKLNETWEVVADVRRVREGSEFEIVVQATYWNAFDTPETQWYATYPNNQAAPQTASILIMFPDGKPFKEYSLWSYPHGSSEGQRFKGTSTEIPGPGDLSLYWEVSNAQGNKTLEVRWTF
jgi:hypothetical protein